MSKARTKARKLADKRRRQFGELPEVAPIPKRKSRGDRRMSEIRHEADESIPAYQARLRQMGKTSTEANMREAKAQWQGCEAGKAMSAHISAEQERATLWDAIQHMRKVYLAYDRAMGAPNRHAQCLRIMLPLEAMEADASSPPLDDRTDEEKQRQADAAKQALRVWLANVEPRAAMVCLSTVIDDMRCADPAAMVRALHCVADGMAGRKQKCRAA